MSNSERIKNAFTVAVVKLLTEGLPETLFVILIIAILMVM